MNPGCCGSRHCATAGTSITFTACSTACTSAWRWNFDFENTEYYQVYVSPMQLNLELAHEVDLLRYFRDLDKDRPGVYQLRGCTLSTDVRQRALPWRGPILGWLRSALVHSETVSEGDGEREDS